MPRRPAIMSVRGALGAATAALLHLSCAPVPEHQVLLVAAVQVKRSFDRLLGPRQPLDATSHRKLAADKKNEFVVTDLKTRLLAEACFGSEEAAKLPHKYEPAKKDEPLLDLVKGGKKDGSSCTTASAKPLALRDSTNVRAGKMNTSTGIINNSSPFGFSTEQAGATSSTSRAPFLLRQTRGAEEFRTLRRDIHKKENQLANPVKVLDPSTKLSALVVEDTSTTTAGSSRSSRRSRSTAAAKESTLVKKYGQITDSCACVLAITCKYVWVWELVMLNGHD